MRSLRPILATDGNSIAGFHFVRGSGKLGARDDKTDEKENTRHAWHGMAADAGPRAGRFAELMTSRECNGLDLGYGGRRLANAAPLRKIWWRPRIVPCQGQHSLPVGTKGSLNNNYAFSNADASRLAVLRKGLHRLAMRPFARLARRAPRRPKTSSYC